MDDLIVVSDIPSEELAASLPASRDLALAYLVGRQADASRMAAVSDMRQVSEAFGIGAANWEDIPWTQLRAGHIEALRSVLAETRAPATVNRILSTVRGLLKKAYLEEHLTGRELEAIRDVAPVRGHREPRGRRLSRGELRRLFDEVVSAPGRRAIRDAGLLGLAFGLGLRRSELTALRLEDYDRVRQELLVHGKGNKDRRLPVDNGAQVYLDRWIDARGTGPGPVFLRFEKGDRMTRSGIGGQAVYDAMRYWAKRAGIENFSPHDARRTFVTGLLENGVDLSIAGDLAGHASIQTTKRYDHRGFDDMRRAVGSWQIPVVQASASSRISGAEGPD